MAATLSGWQEAIIFSIAVLSIATIIIFGYNSIYGSNLSIGLNDSSNSRSALVEYVQSGSDNLNGGEVDFSATQGIQVKSSWGLLKAGGNLVWNFFKGGWIEQNITALGLGPAGDILGLSLRILFNLSVIAGLLFVVSKVFQ